MGEEPRGRWLNLQDVPLRRPGPCTWAPTQSLTGAVRAARAQGRPRACRVTSAPGLPGRKAPPQRAPCRFLWSWLEAVPRWAAQSVESRPGARTTPGGRPAPGEATSPAREPPHTGLLSGQQASAPLGL